MNAVAELLVGDFDNFQQAWQQNTDTPIHVVNTDYPHRQIHAVIQELDGEDGLYDTVLYAYFYADRNINNVVFSALYAFEGTSMTVLRVQDDDISNAIASWEASDKLEWKQNDDGSWQAESDQTCWWLSQKGWYVEDRQPNSLFFNAESVAFRLLRCRFFTGWIEIPYPADSEEIYRFPNLRLHDQGDKIQLLMPDGSLGAYTVELTQLVFGQSIPIMKLAVYQESSEVVTYNSRSISYTWTNPEAQRIGINLRSIISGWTLENSGLLASKNP